jgi:hypothetical protein
MKIFKCIILLILTSPIISVAQDIYRWEDEHGVVHFSEHAPPPTASHQQQISLPDNQAPSPAPRVLADQPVSSEKKPTLTQQVKEKLLARLQAKTAPQQAGKDPSDVLLDINIVTPTDDQTIRSNRGIITVVLENNRNLKPGERYQLLMDENPYGAPQTNTTWNLKNIDRGTHSFTINALQSGKVIASTSTIKVHLHRNSVNK